MTMAMARKEHPARGLSAGNPLHVLAALGTFRLLELRDPGARMGWFSGDDGGTHPRYETTLGKNDVGKALAESFGWQEGEEEQREKRAPKRSKGDAKGEEDQKSTKNPRRERLKERFPVVFEEVPVEAKASDADGTSDGASSTPPQGAAQDSGEDRKRGMQEALRIARPPADFRRMALGAISSHWGPQALLLQEELVAAFGCDACIEKKKNTVTPSLLSFSNGGSGKYLLKDFKNCALRATPESVARTLFGPSPNVDVAEEGCFCLNWSPEDCRSHALQWNDPGDSKVKEPCDATANALAFLGLCCVPSAPGKRGLMTAGFSPRGDEWVYPVWEPLLPLAVVRSLLLQNPRQMPQDRGDLALVWWKAKKYAKNHGRPFFAPGIPMVGEERRGRL